MSSHDIPFKIKILNILFQKSDYWTPGQLPKPKFDDDKNLGDLVIGMPYVFDKCKRHDKDLNGTLAVRMYQHYFYKLFPTLLRKYTILIEQQYHNTAGGGGSRNLSGGSEDSRNLQPIMVVILLLTGFNRGDGGSAPPDPLLAGVDPGFLIGRGEGAPTSDAVIFR